MRYEFGGALGAGRIEATAPIVNRFYWHLTVHRSQSAAMLYTGDKVIGTFDNESELEAFVAGMALALSVLPPSAVDAIDREVGP
jgi:hypothetical protein